MAQATRYLPGYVYRATHQTAADTILNPMGLHRKVYSRGDKFFNHDRWTLRLFSLKMCEWVDDNPYKRPSRQEVQAWVDAANSWDLIDVHRRDQGQDKENEERHHREGAKSEPFIQIPATPNRLTKFLADALRGGAYHEALHTACDIRDDIHIDEVWPILQENWDLVPNWAQFTETLLYWENELCDVKNELWGCKEFEGITKYLHAVHDNRIAREIDSIEKMKRAGIYVPNRHSFTVKAFRHFAFGYDSPMQKKAMEFYMEECPEAVGFCTHGPFRSLISEARRQDEYSRVHSLGLGMRMVGSVYEAAFAYPDNIMGDILGKVRNMQTWGHCHIDPSMSLVARAIMGDFDKKPQHQDTMEAIRESIENFMAQNALRSPMSYDYDTVEMASGTGNMDNDRRESIRRTQEVRKDIAYYRSKLRTLVKAQELTGVHHGVEDGIDLSDEMLVDTIVALRAGEYPEEAFYEEDEQIDTSTAVYVLGDQSSSMYGNIREACKVILSILDPLHALQVKTMASGFYSTDGNRKDMNDYWEAQGRTYWSNRDDDDEKVSEKDAEHIKKRFSRPWGVHHTVYKLWDEDYTRTRWRFADYKAAGGTPMADGLQFALNALQGRTEGHRLLFCVTDGMPDSGTEDEIKMLLDLAHDAGIVVVGVGFGASAQYVQTLFRESVWDSTIQGLPQKLIKKLNKLMNFRGEGPRGKKLSQRVVEPRRRAG